MILMIVVMATKTMIGEMDQVTFARYYPATTPFLAEHGRKMHKLLDQRVASWLEGSD